MIEKIIQYDSNFTESEFKTFVDNVFIQIHIAIMTKEIEKIKHFVADQVYQTLVQKVTWLTEKHLIQMYDEINVKETHLLYSEIKDGEIIIKVKLISRYMDYLMDEDGNFVSGNNQSRIEKENDLVFVKKISVDGKEKVKKCPGCGASMDVNTNGKCNYCGTIYNLEDKNFILTSLEVK